MGWNDLREKWQSLDPSSDADTQAILTRARRREKKLMRRVYIRDALETIVAVLIAPAMVALAWKLFAHGLIFAGISAAALAVWAAFVPVRLWYARRRGERAKPDQNVVEFLHAERQKCETQARMLETVVSGAGLGRMCGNIRGDTRFWVKHDNLRLCRDSFLHDDIYCQPVRRQTCFSPACAGNRRGITNAGRRHFVRALDRRRASKLAPPASSRRSERAEYVMLRNEVKQ